MSDGGSLTYFTKEPIECPICDDSFYREELRRGRGRLIAGELTKELRRQYEPSQKYGEVYPIVYSVTVCPHCFYAALREDFAKVPENIRPKLHEESENRLDSMSEIFDSLDFTEPRGLPEGIAGYFLAILCYEHFPKEFSPTFKQGLASLRAAWLSGDLHRKQPTENFDYLSNIFYRKARFFYSLAVERETTGKEPIPNETHLGPDTDKNYGYDGVLYLSGLLEFLYGPKSDPEKRRVALDRAKRTVAKIFGMGKASKHKPQAILDNARDVYEEIAKELGDENKDPEKQEPDA
ncbi:MAG: DUF2225 domain-containing protein [Spirochaetes bacterium]|nr:DUF2225 domain-containing protein [Spirochaetota bacterium]